MKSKVLSVVLMAIIALTIYTPGAYAMGGRAAGASLLLPTTGQAMNGEVATTKTKVMAGVEIAAITTVAILGGFVGGGVVWAGLGPLIANHIWSATDAYQEAQNGRTPMMQSPMSQAQQTLDYSRQRRYDRAEDMRGDLRQRMQQAAETGQVAY